MKKKNRVIRIIPRLDIKNGQLIKGINLEGLRILGDPYEFANYYYKSFADEIYYVDNVATLYGINNLSKFISRTAKNLYIPLTVGGGIKTIPDIEKALKAGADKVCINSAAIDDVNFIKKASRIYGSSTISVGLECIKIKKKYFISKSSGRDLVDIRPLDWAKKLEDSGAGEIVVTAVNKEGLGEGFDIPLIKQISRNITVPTIAHGGAGSYQHIYNVIKNTTITGVALSSFLHYEATKLFKIKKKKIGNYFFIDNLKKNKKITNNLENIKTFLQKKGIDVRV